ncbi:MAG: hypothetical protein AAGH19_10750 [Pseudomonadota bacterium]
MNASVSERSYDQRAIRDNLAFVGWVFVWMLSLTVSDKAALYGWWSAEWITWGSIVVNFALGVWLVLRYVRMLSGMDDLQRKIQLEALAMSFGITLVCTISYSLLVTWGYITDEEVTDIFMIMCVSFSLAVIGSTLRYR